MPPRAAVTACSSAWCCSSPGASRSGSRWSATAAPDGDATASQQFFTSGTSALYRREASSDLDVAVRGAPEGEPSTRSLRRDPERETRDETTDGNRDGSGGGHRGTPRGSGRARL